MKGIIFANCTYNNTIITLTDKKGNTIGWSSSGSNKFKGSKKSTPFAAQICTEKLIKKFIEKKIDVVDVKFKGPGNGRDSILRVLNNNNINILSITDLTPIPHNGCRPPKKRRV
ncbi:30S ribosomal protein S11 [Candidatus Vidania fulgoroideorum]